MIHFIYIYFLIAAFLWGHVLGTSARPRKVFLGTAILASLWLITFPAAICVEISKRLRFKETGNKGDGK